MKNLKIIIIIFISLTATLFSKEGWYEIYIPSDTNITCLDFANDKLGVILTEKLEVFLTIDGGNTFVNKTKSFPIKTKSNNIDIKCIKANEIYVLNNYSIYVSIDSCNTWHEINNTSINNDTLKCIKFHKFDSICYCESENQIYYSNNNMQSWEIINSALKYKDTRWTQTAYSKNSFAVKYFVGDVMSGTYSYIRFYKGKDSANLCDIRPMFTIAELERSNLTFLNDSLFIINYLEGIWLTSNMGKKWTKYFVGDLFGSNIAIINNKISAYFYTDKIYKLIDKKVIKSKISKKLDRFINKIKVIDENIAYGLLGKSSDLTSIANYFLKTEDGGGVDLSDVEEVITQDEITQSSHIELYDILGRSIATFPSYEKLKAEIENYPPPHLLKWRDEKGISHFDRMK